MTYEKGVNLDWLVYITKIAYQPVMAGFMYLVANQYKVSKEIRLRRGTIDSVSDLHRRRNLSLGIIVVLSTLEGLYSVICGPKDVFLADREYYAIRFERESFRQANSLGVYYIQHLLNHYTHNPYVFFYVSGLLFLLVTLLAYRYSMDVTLLFFGLLCCSQYLMYGCYQIKQAIAIAISGLAIVLLLRYHSLAIPGLLIAIAICFHEIAWIMIPLCIAIRYSDRLSVKLICYITLAATILWFPEISRRVITLINRYIPSVSLQVTQYVDETGAVSTHSGRLLSVLKGIPFYYVALIGLVKSEDLKNKINNYDAYMMISMIISATSVLNLWNYWLWRFGELLYIPYFCFVCKIHASLEDKRERINFATIVLGFLAIFTYRKLFMCYFQYGGII